MMWMGAGIGATLLYKKYNNDVKEKIKKTTKEMSNKL